MKNLVKLGILLIIFISSACEKPFFQAQFPGRWQMIKVQLNGFDYDMSKRSMFLVLGESGNYWSVIGEKEEATGTWELKADENILVFTEKNGTPRINQIREVSEDTLILYREEDKAEAFLKRIPDETTNTKTKEQ